MRTTAAFLFAALVASTTSAEPTFLAKQYTRCTPCHYSPTGGGLLTPYGRLLSHRELSSTGRTAPAPDAGADKGAHGEETFLFGAPGTTPGPLQLGVELRPSWLRIGSQGVHDSAGLLMSADVMAAMRVHGWTGYATVGREPPGAAVRSGRAQANATLVSREHWIAYQGSRGFGIRAGRFLPAYGVRFADHTSYSRVGLGFDRDDQVYGLEVSRTTDDSLLQVTVSPGRAEAILHDHDRRGSSVSARWQRDLSPVSTVVASGTYRHSTRATPRSTAVGVAFGTAWRSRLSLWTEADAVDDGRGAGLSWVVVHEASVEIARGVRLTLSPQLRTPGGAPGSSDKRRLAAAVDLLPRTHWHVNVSYYRDRAFRVTTSILLAQLHLYL